MRLRIGLGVLALCAFAAEAPAGDAVRIGVGVGTGVAGGRVELPISLLAGEPRVVAVEVALFFDPALVDLAGSSACSIADSIGRTAAECAGPAPSGPCKDLVVTLVDCEEASDCPPAFAAGRRAGLIVISLTNVNPIPNGPLATCSFDVAASLAPGAEVPVAVRAEASDTEGIELATTAEDAAIVVIGDTPSATPTSLPTATEVPPLGCPGDCGGNGVVSIDELIRGVRVALGSLAVENCPSLDRDGDRRVLINELIAAVSAALSGCAAPFATATPVLPLPIAPTS